MVHDNLRIGLVGSGAMGLPMAKRLLSGGYSLTVVPHRNRTPAEELARLGASVVSTPRELAGLCDLIITSLPDVPDVEAVLFGPEGLAEGEVAGRLYVDMSTITPVAAADFHKRLSALNCDALDAPVSGGPARAADGTLTIMVGGSNEGFERAKPVLEVLGGNIVHVGGSGAGQAVKLVNQLMISIIMVANVEALSLGVKAGIPLETLVHVISTSSGSNYLMQSWLPRTLFAGSLDSGFALDLLMKDLNAALGWAKELGAPVFGGAQAQQLYRTVKALEANSGRLDYSVVARLYEEANGVELRLPPA